MADENPTYNSIKFKSIQAPTDMYTASALYNKHEIETMSGNLADQISQAVSTVYKVCGSVQDLAELYNIENPKIGDVYNVSESGDNYVYVGLTATGSHITSGWDNLGSIIDLTPYTRWETVSGPINTLTANSDNWSNTYTYVSNNSGKIEDAANYGVFSSITAVTATSGYKINPDSTYTISDIVTSINNLVTVLSAVYTSASTRS